MIKIYKNKNEVFNDIQDIQLYTWINLFSPKREELEGVSNLTGCSMDFLMAALDESELPRYEQKNNEYLVLTNVVYNRQQEEENLIYDTIPLALIVIDNFIISVCLEEIDFLKNFYNVELNLDTIIGRERFLMKMLYRISIEFIKALHDIEKISKNIEENMRRSPNNKSIIELFSLEKTMIYFKSSIKANRMVILRLSKMNWSIEYKDITELLEDVQIEFFQAMDMTETTINVIAGLRQTFSSLISNNLDNTMKILASITILLTVPTMIFSFYGINLDLNGLPWFFQSADYVLGLSIILTIILFVVLKKKNML